MNNGILFDKNYLIINSIKSHPSLCDGPGYRTVLFLQGCNLHCKGCHNKSSWDINKGIKITVKDLAFKLREKCFNKKLTITGGEPLFQQDALINLLLELKDFDICLYTGHEINDVPKEIIRFLKYIKVGPFVLDLMTTIKPYVGSTNQELIEVNYEKTE